MFALFSAGLFFLWNPLVNVIDILPDCIGWLLFALGLTRLAYLREDFAEIRKKAWILCAISFAKFLPMYWSLAGDIRYPLAAEPTMVLTYTVSFGAAELFLGISVFRSFFSTLSSLGTRYGSIAANRKLGRLRFRTIAFLIVRAVCSVLPELVYLRSTEYLDRVVYGVVIDIRDYRPYLIFLFSLIAGIVGLCWYIAFVRYLRTLRREDTFNDALRAEEEERREEISGYTAIARFRTVFGLLFLGAVFFCYLSVDRINVLPDFVGVLLMCISVLLLRKTASPPESFRAVGIFTLVVTLPYAVFRTVKSIGDPISWTYTVSDFLTGNVELTAEKEAQLHAQYITFAISLAETAVIILFFRLLLQAIRSLDALTFPDGVTLYDSMTGAMQEKEKRIYMRRPVICLVLFSLSVLMEPIQTLPLFAFLITPIFLVRFAFNAAFLWVFSDYLLSVYRMMVCHYSYN